MTVTPLTREQTDAVDAPTAPGTPGAPGVPPQGRAPQYPLGWLRGLAALCVVVFHSYQHHRDPQTWAWPWSGAAHQAMLGTDLFVDMFFVLSGLVLWLPVARACVDGAGGRPGRVLLMRRMARLLPLYYVIVLAVWATTTPSLPGHWQDLVMHLTFTQIYSDQYIFWTDGPAWSLAVEFHFYVLMALAVPLVNAAVRRVADRRARLAVVSVLPALCIAVGLGFLVWATVLTSHADDAWSVWFSAPSRAADFGLGMALAVLVAAGVRLGRVARSTLGVLGLAALGVLVMTRPFDDTPTSEWWHPLYSAAVALLLAGIVLHAGPWSRFFDWRPLAFVGTLGYGVYLVHEPVMRFLGHLGVLPDPRPGLFFLWTALLVAVPSLALAWLSSRTVEPAGLRLLATMDKQGRRRDYYEHLEQSSATPGAGEAVPGSGSGSSAVSPPFPRN
ncbi:MAG: acyltransferase [Nocardioides sp.]|nr:acyltransferase [Nocardioidaceae bacterium]MCB8957679.1 acyltransferase [Nocardioides sp.]